jgi:pyruvate,water dikinase
MIPVVDPVPGFRRRRSGQPLVAGSGSIKTDPAIVTELIARSRASVAAAQRDIQTKSGSELLDFIRTDIQELRRVLFDPQSHQAITAGMEASWLITDQLATWLGDSNTADVLTQSVPNNVTSEMGLALLGVNYILATALPRRIGYPASVVASSNLEPQEMEARCPRSAAGRHGLGSHVSRDVSPRRHQRAPRPRLAPAHVRDPRPSRGHHR